MSRFHILVVKVDDDNPNPMPGYGQYGLSRWARREPLVEVGDWLFLARSGSQAIAALVAHRRAAKNLDKVDELTGYLGAGEPHIPNSLVRRRLCCYIARTGTMAFCALPTSVLAVVRVITAAVVMSRRPMASW